MMRGDGKYNRIVYTTMESKDRLDSILIVPKDKKKGKMTKRRKEIDWYI